MCFMLPSPFIKGLSWSAPTSWRLHNVFQNKNHIHLYNTNDLPINGTVGHTVANVGMTLAFTVRRSLVLEFNLSVESLHVLPVYVWVSSRYSGFLPQHKDVLRLIKHFKSKVSNIRTAGLHRPAKDCSIWPHMMNRWIKYINTSCSGYCL